MTIINENLLPCSYQNSGQLGPLPENEQKVAVTAPQSNTRLMKTWIKQPALLLVISLCAFSIAFTTRSLYFTQLEPLEYQLNEIQAIGSPCANPTGGPFLDGFDVVSYFQSGPEKGSAEIRTTFEGYTLYFKSELNKSLFESNPDKYIPQYGGFCTNGAAYEDEWTASTFCAPADPRNYLILNGKIYLFNDGIARGFFTELDVAKGVQAGDEHWKIWYGDQTVLNTGCFHGPSSVCYGRISDRLCACEDEDQSYVKS
eukprot:CAMPEP_0113952344 /NCGR_PEP_ID=MMETSP1339-20121228/90359_1 /TAXON_ID=94617 /ORGANISM="Fibrocapsa japonica" /LENGTH=256 /DNA_ID=CAMNT_0000960933 /DNA_START=86 /DNA_END=856 /DNA_ORIENTATION=+ /assembly_acc=CAM_ASM_000762